MDLKPEDAEDEMESSDWTGSCSFTWSDARERQSLERFRPKCGGLLLSSAVWEVVGLEHSVWVGVPPNSPHRQIMQSSVPPKFLRGDSWGRWFHSYWLWCKAVRSAALTVLSCLHASEFYVFIGCSSCADRLVVSDQPQFHFSAVDRTKWPAPVLLPPFNLDDVTLQTVWWSLLLNIQSLALKLGEAFSCLFKWGSIIKCLCEIRPPAVIGRLMRRWRSVAVQLC